MTPALPSTSDDLTPEVLNPLLADAPQFADAEIVETEVVMIGTETGNIGDIARVSLTLANGPSSAPGSIVAKLPAQNETAREFGFSGGADEHEFLFYKHLSADCGLPVPDCYFAGFDQDARKIVLLIEDLADYDDLESVDNVGFETASQVVLSHAAMHAKWWGGQRLRHFDWLERALDRREVVRSKIPIGLEKAPGLGVDLWPVGVLDIANQGTKILDLLEDRSVDRPKTLVQVDCKSGNVMRSRSGGHERRLKFIDFGSISIGAGAGDIAYFSEYTFDPDTPRSMSDSW